MQLAEEGEAYQIEECAGVGAAFLDVAQDGLTLGGFEQRSNAFD